MQRHAWCAGLVAGSLMLAACDRTPPAPPIPADHEAQVLRWREKHETDYRRDWVTVAGLHFLAAGRQTIGSGAGNDIVVQASLPARTGVITVAGDSVRFEALPGVAVTRKGQALTGPVTLREPGNRPADDIVIDGVSLVIHLTGDRMALRVRDPNGPPAKAFLGFSWFAIDPSYRVVGSFVRDAEPRQLVVPNTFAGTDTYTTEGVVEFELHGQTLRLRPFTTRPKRLYFVFRDGSSGVETYETARFLYADLRDDGLVVLDFNEAYNPPCAFNKYTTCPLPLKENVMPVKVLAGERAYGAKTVDRRP